MKRGGCAWLPLADKPYQSEFILNYIPAIVHTERKCLFGTGTYTGRNNNAMDHLEALKEENYIDGDGREISLLCYDIAFKNVDFGYDSRQVLKNVYLFHDTIPGNICFGRSYVSETEMVVTESCRYK